MLEEADRKKFSAALAELGVALNQIFVAGHNNTLQAFVEQWGKPKRIFRATNGVEVHIWQSLRQSKRSPVTDVYAAEFGSERAFHVVSSSHRPG